MSSVFTPARFRLAVQAVFTVFCVHVGMRFAAFLAWALGQSDTFVAKPGAVEGFLPISALLAARQFFATGQWDQVHPAGLTIFFAVVVMAFLFRKGFCAYICPVGFLANILDRAGRVIGLSKVPPKRVDMALSSIKYLGLGFFAYTVFISMDLKSVQGFLAAPYNMVSDAKMLDFFMSPSPTSLMVVGVLIAISLVIRTAWCRYLCPYGALLGLVSWFSPTAIARDKDACVGCGKCTAGCPAGIEVEKKSVVRSPECIGCTECIGNCPVDGCITVSLMNKNRLPWVVLCVGAVIVLLGFWGWAKATGHWDVAMPPFMLKRIYTMFYGVV